MRSTGLGLIVLGSTLFAGQSVAGPPLLCRQYEIGSAPSLPWGDHPKGPLAQYSRDRLVEDTLRLLAPAVPVLVRMETLRRATYYVEGRADLAGELLARLSARTLDAESLGKPDALAWFDAGYFTASLKQMEHRPASPKLASGIDGYRWVRRAIQLRKQTDPAMEFAAALINNEHPGRPGQHWALATSGAKSDSLLSKNLALYQRF